MSGSNEHGASRRRARATKQALKALDFMKRGTKGKPLPALTNQGAGATDTRAESIHDPRSKTHAEGRGPLE